MSRPGGPKASRLARVALAPVAGGLVGCSLPPFGPWYLAPIGLGAAAWLIRGQPIGRRLLLGWLVGLGQFAIGCVWALEFTGLGYVVLVGFEALFVAVAFAAVPPGRGRLVAFAGALTLAEWARETWPFGGLPIGSVALGQAPGPLVGLARVGGPLALVVAAALAGAGLAAVGFACWTELTGDEPFARRGAFCGLAVLVVVAAATGLAGLSPDGGPPRGVVTVAVVQGGGRRGIGSVVVPAGRVFAATWGATAPLRAPVDLIVWPEDAMPLAGPLPGSTEAGRVAALARRLHATVLAGVTAPAGAHRFVNEIVAWGPSGRVLGRVEKAHPVPFGEYVPLRWVFARIASLTAVPRDVVVGRNDGELTTPAGRVAILNSFEDFFAARARSGVRAGGELLIVETNTASYATDVIPAEELAASRIQAVAFGRDLVQSATTGYSAVVTPAGAVAAQSRLGSPDLLRSRVALRTGATLYARFGDWLVLAIAATALVAGWALQLGGRPRGGGARRQRAAPGVAA